MNKLYGWNYHTNLAWNFSLSSFQTPLFALYHYRLCGSIGTLASAYGWFQPTLTGDQREERT